MNDSLRTLFFFFNDTATTEIYTLSLHDALPISDLGWDRKEVAAYINNLRSDERKPWLLQALEEKEQERSEEHTSELQSQSNLVCRLLLEKKKKRYNEPDKYQVRKN